MDSYKYTVLLVDDEEEVIQVIMKKIDWEGLGFSVIGYANNGVKALEMVEEYQPDVVMTDIRMPYMDGMELAHRIREEFPGTKILIFTGFDEFEYAKEAVHLEVEEYILKPVNSVEMTKVFGQMKAKLDQEISEKRNAETLQRYYLESLPLLQANFYTTLIEGRAPVSAAWWCTLPRRRRRRACLPCCCPPRSRSRLRSGWKKDGGQRNSPIWEIPSCWPSFRMKMRFPN